MSSIDRHHEALDVVALNTTAIAAAGTVAGNWVNTLQSGSFQSAEFILQVGARATAPTALSIVVKEADLADYSDAAVVDPAFILGDLTVEAARLNAANTSCRFGYAGQKTYVQVSVVTTGTPSLTVSGMCMLADPRFAPTPPDTTIASRGY